MIRCMEVLETEDPLGSYRSELFAHCYRMLGSHHDAQDVLQEVSLRALRGRPKFEGRSSLRTWLHRITVNACLNELDRKERRIMPINYGPEAGPDDGFDNRLEHVLWVEPTPSDPQQRAEYLVSIELAFVVAVQQLSANQRVALIMFDVLGFSAAEIAEAMATTPPSVNSALQRARERLSGALPARSQRAQLADLGDAGQRGLVNGYADALERRDMGALLALLTEDATWSMPPLANWYRGKSSIAAFLTAGPFTQAWRHVPTQANGQLAVAGYLLDDTGAYTAYVLDVIEVRGDRIASVVAFLSPDFFAAFGLPDRLPG